MNDNKMKGKNAIIIVLLVSILIFSSVITGVAAKRPSSPPPKPPPIEFNNQNGLNYAGAYWHFDSAITTDEVLNRDFALFQNGNIDLICLNIHWSYLEPEMGSYRISYLDDIVRVCNIANQYGISVVLDFHTLMNLDSYTIPSWVAPRTFDTVVHDFAVRQAWLNMLSYSAEYISSRVSNVHSWHMMNEPYIGAWAVQCSVDDFIQLWIDMKSAIRQYSDLPVSIRFGTDSILTSFNDDPRIYEILDYITVTWYESYLSVSNFKSLIQDIKAHGKDVMVGEWGYSTNKDNQQYDKFVSYMDIFKELEIKWTLAWLWRSDSSQITNPGNLGKGFILCDDAMGTPRRAFYAITAGNT